MRLFLAAFILHLSAFILSAQTVGQFELRKRTSGGFTSYGITPENGKAIGFTAGVPAMITVGGSGSGTGDALIGDPLSQFAATTSQQLRGVLSDESGTGLFLTTTGSGASLTGITSGQISGLGTLATQSATITDYITSAAAAAAYQPLDSDLTSIAALVTTTAGRALLDDADAAAQRTTLGLGSLATQSGTFSGTSSGTNTGDQDLSAYLTSVTAASTYAPLASPSFTGQIVADGDIQGRVAGVTRYSDGMVRFFGGANASPWHGGLGGSLLLQGADAVGSQHGGNGGSLNMYGTAGQNAGSITTIAGGSLTMGTADLAGGSVAGTILTTAGSGASLTNLNADNISSGTVAAARLGSGSSITTKYLRGDNTWQTISGGGDALTSGTLAQFAATTSAQLTGILSDESGTGVILTTTGSGASLTGITSGQISGLGTLATQSATITDYITSAAAAAAYQPLDSDLTSIAALITTTAGRALLDDADASAQRTTLGLAVGADVQAYSASTSLLGSSIDLSTEITGTLALANGGTGSALTDPNADRIAFWDDSAGVMTWLTAGSGLTITGTTITASGGGGSAPQPVQAVLTTTATTTSTTYADITGLTASYTPSSTTQKVLVRGSVSFGSTSTNQTAFRLARGGSALTVATTSGSRTVAHVSFIDLANGLGMETATFEFLDTPGTTSSVTYSIQWKRGGSSGACYLNRAQDDLDYDSRANTVSTLTVIPFAE